MATSLTTKSAFTIFIGMLKSFSFRFFALCASFSLFACSEEKADPPPPSLAELCKQPITAACLTAGNWTLENVEDTTFPSDCTESGSLELRGDGRFIFTGGYNPIPPPQLETSGSWQFTDDNRAIVVTYMELGVQTTGTVTEVSSDGKTMRIKGDGIATFSLCPTGKTEKFTR